MPGSPFHAIESVPRDDLERLFDEEAAMWAGELSWSFEPTRRRLRDALEEGTLCGLVAIDERGACAYATYAMDAQHGVVGSFFASARTRGHGIEGLLVRQVLNRLLAQGPQIVDCQTLFSSNPGLLEPFAECGFESASRVYMTLERSDWLYRTLPSATTLRSRPIHRTDLRAVARLVYEAHLDTRRLDASSSFDTLDSCERILGHIIVDQVCGPFDSMASRRVESGDQPVAVSLLTWPSPGVAHISEVATSPARRRQGLARQCLVEALGSAFDRGAKLATLSVTASNQAAVRLYESLGFLPRVRYESHVLRGLKSRVTQR